MRIIDVRETVVPIQSAIRNAYIDFSQMTVSVVALVTDVVRDGRPVVGFGFHSNGRYAPSGLLRERFVPRLRAADPETLLTEARDARDPEVFRPFNGFADDRRIEDGHVVLSDAPGIGCERKAEFYEVIRALAA